MLDLQPAFDTVDHVICSKTKMGVKSVYRLILYLSNIRSDPSLVNCGVPLGRSLGPLLVLFYVNDMDVSISSGSKLKTVNAICTHKNIMRLYKNTLVTDSWWLTTMIAYGENRLCFLWIKQKTFRKANYLQ